MHLNDMLTSKRKGRVALIRAEHEESLLTVKRGIEENLADFILIGDGDIIREKAESLGISLERCDIRPVQSDKDAADMGARLAADKEIDVLMKGMIQTSVFTKALLNREWGLIPEGGLISHMGLFELPGLDRPVGITDAALNIQPDLSQKIIILSNAIAVMHRLGVALVKAACIAPVEMENPKIPSTIDAAALSRMDWEGALVEGPLALDAALSAKAAAVKGIESALAGEPDLLLFPDLNTANAVYKAFAFTPGSRNAGILAGLSLPVILTSRSDPEETRYLSLKLALGAME